MQQQDLKPSSKAPRIALNGEIAQAVAGAMGDIEEAWCAASTEDEFWDLLDWPNEASTEQYGDRKWVAIPSRGEEFRIAVMRNRKGVLSLDFRLWWS